MFEPYYYALLMEARERTAKAITSRILRTGRREIFDGLELASITEDAIRYAKEEWPQFYGADTHMGFSTPWETLHRRYAHCPDMFHLAVWQTVDGERVLAALAIGNPSHGKTHVTIKWIERYFGKTYIAGRTLYPILTCAEEYAKLLGAERVLIKDPLDPEKYARYEYEEYHHPHLAYGGNYMGKDV